MANVVRIPYSNTSGNTPSSLANGQIAINQSSGSLFYRNAAGAVTAFSPAADLADGYVYDCGAYTATFVSPNAAWTAIGFTNAGTAASPYTKATVASSVADGAQITVVSSGTIRVTATSAYSDYDLIIYKNGVAALTLSDNTGGNGYSGAVNATISVAGGDVIRLGNASDFTGYSALNFWWQ
jgi:hypothetical protein